MAENNNNNRQSAENINSDEIIMLLKKLILNTKQNKQTPYDIKIKNSIKEPKIKEDMRYTPKQKYRKYKTKIEPNLLNNINIDEEDDIVAKIKDEFDSKNKQKQMELIKTSEAPYHKPPDPDDERRLDVFKRSGNLRVDDRISDVSPAEATEITGLVPEEFTPEELRFRDEMEKYYARYDLQQLLPKFAKTNRAVKMYNEYKELSNKSSPIRNAVRRKFAMQGYNTLKYNEQMKDTIDNNKAASRIQAFIKGHKERATYDDMLFDEEQSKLSTAVAESTPVKRRRGRPLGSYGIKRRTAIAAEDAAIKIKEAKKKNNPTGPFSFKNTYAQNSLLGYY